MNKCNDNRSGKATQMNKKSNQNPDQAPIALRLSGRIEYLRKIKRVKDPELMASALEVMTDLADAVTRFLELTENMPDDGSTPALSFCRMRCEIAIEKINGETK